MTLISIVLVFSASQHHESKRGGLSFAQLFVLEEIAAESGQTEGVQ